MSTAVNALLLAFFDICRMRRAPQDLPASSFLLGTMLVVFTLLNYAVGILDSPPRLALLATLLNTAIMVLFTAVSLWLHHHSARFTQTLTALVGSGTLLTLFFLPIAGLGNALSSQQVSIAVLGIWLLLLAWDVLIMAHIFRHALSVQMSFGFVVALLYLWLTFSSMYAFIYPLLER